jgi:coenzyme F420-0:L-glutamate ligase
LGLRHRNVSKTVLIPVRIRLVKPGQVLEKVIIQALAEEAVTPLGHDIVAIASKICSICESRIVRLGEVAVTARAQRIAVKWQIDQRLAALVTQEADRIIGGVPGFLLTVKNGILTANAGIDLKNTLPGTAVLWPHNPDRTAARLRRALEEEFDVTLGVIVVDSRITPLRLGTIGVAIGVSGVRPVRDMRELHDLYGRKVKATQVNIADDVASSAHLLMGEANERVGAVVLRNAPIAFSYKGSSRQALIPTSRCLIMNNLRRK